MPGFDPGWCALCDFYTFNYFYKTRAGWFANRVVVVVGWVVGLRNFGDPNNLTTQRQHHHVSIYIPGGQKILHRNTTPKTLLQAQLQRCLKQTFLCKSV